MKNKVIPAKYLPSHPIRPARDGAVAYLLMDKLNAPEWLFGLVLGLYFIMFLTSFVLVFTQKPFDMSKLEK